MTELITGIGSAIFALLAANAFPTIEKAQEHICLTYTTFTPQPEEQKVCDKLYEIYKPIYFDFGRPGEGDRFGGVLPKLIRIARRDTEA